MTRGSRCRARQFRRPVCWRTSSTTATGTALVRTPSVTCSLSCRPSTRQQPFWPMAAHSIPRAPPVLPFQQNLLLVQHLWISILCKTLLNGIVVKLALLKILQRDDSILVTHQRSVGNLDQEALILLFS